MLTRVVVTSRTTPGRTYTIPVTSATSAQPFIAKRIDGLGPVDAEFAYSGQVFRDGVTVSSSKAGARNIVLYLGLNQRRSSTDGFQALRRELYPHLSPQMHIDLQFNFTFVGGASRKISGIVEKMEPTYFQQEPVIQVSIICEQPYFEASSPLTVPWTSTTGTSNREWVSSWGDAPTGFVYECEWTANPTIGSFIFANSPDISPMWNRFTVTRSVLSSTPIPSGSRLRFSTVPNEKSLEYQPAGGSFENGLAAITRGVLNLELGPQTPGFYESVGVAHTASLTFTPKFLGL